MQCIFHIGFNLPDMKFSESVPFIGYMSKLSAVMANESHLYNVCMVVVILKILKQNTTTNVALSSWMLNYTLY